MDRERIERCLEVVRAYRASGQKSKDWAQANGVPERVLVSWCAHARRWQARLDGVAVPALNQGKSSGFVAARLAPNASVPTAQTVQVELSAGTTRIALHWPLAHTGELAAFVREMAR